MFVQLFYSADSEGTIRDKTLLIPFGQFFHCCYFSRMGKIHTCRNRTNIHALMYADMSKQRGSHTVKLPERLDTLHLPWNGPCWSWTSRPGHGLRYCHPKRGVLFQFLCYKRCQAFSLWPLKMKQRQLTATHYKVVNVSNKEWFSLHILFIFKKTIYLMVKLIN